MLKTLIVEDDAGKRQRLARALADVDGFNVADVTTVADVFAARRSLAETSFDLLILDIALPMRADLDVEPDAGLQLLEELTVRTKSYRLPEHIIGITGYPEIHERAADRFSSRLLTLVFYDPTSSEWEHSLQARVRHLLAAADARLMQTQEHESSLAIICALYSPELTNVLNLPWNWKQISVANDHTIYWRGSYTCRGERRLVHAASCERMGMPAAAVLAMKMINAFRPRYLAMTGIAAGVRGRVRMGDVIVADPSWDWGSGKWTLQGDEPKFLAAPHQLPLDTAIRNKLKMVARDTAALSRIRSAWIADRPPHELEMHVGPLASGASVLADPQTAQHVLAQHRELRGIEMEAYGVYAAAEEASEPRPVAFALKSVVDFADGEKDDRYQTYGAFTSAQVLRHLAEEHL